VTLLRREELVLVGVLVDVDRPLLDDAGERLRGVLPVREP